MKTILTVLALVGVAYWIQRQLAIQRSEAPTRLDLLKKVIERKAA